MKKLPNRCLLALCLVALVASLTGEGSPAPKPPSLTPLWAACVVSSSGSSVFYGGAVDKAGNLYAAGSIKGRGLFDFGNGVTKNNSTDAEMGVLVKYDTDGKALWAQSAQKPESRFNAVAVAASGKPCVAGFAGGQAFLALFAPEGDILWSTVGALDYSDLTVDAESSAYNAITINAEGLFYAAGFAKRTIEIRAGRMDGQMGDLVSPTYKFTKDIRITEGILGVFDEKGLPEAVFGTFYEQRQKLGDVEEARAIAARAWPPVVFLAVAVCTEIGKAVYMGGTEAGSFVIYSLGQSGFDPYKDWFEKDPKTGTRVASRCSCLAIDTQRGDYFAAGTLEGSAPHAIDENRDDSPSVKGSMAVNPLLARLTNEEWIRTASAGSGKSEYKGLVLLNIGLVAAGYIEGTSPYVFGDRAKVSGSSKGKNAVIVQYSDYSGEAQGARSVTSGSLESEFNGLATGVWKWSDDPIRVYALGSMTGKGALSFGSGVSATGTSPQKNALIVKYAVADLNIY